MSLSPRVNACINRGDEVDLTSNWCISHMYRRQFLKTYIEMTVSNSLDIEARFRGHSAIRLYRLESFFKPYFGAHGAREIPVLIPNTEVKPCSGDYTATSGKLARCRIIKRLSE